MSTKSKFPSTEQFIKWYQEQELEPTSGHMTIYGNKCCGLGVWAKVHGCYEDLNVPKVREAFEEKYGKNSYDAFATGFDNGFAGAEYLHIWNREAFGIGKAMREEFYEQRKSKDVVIGLEETSSGSV